MVEGVFSRDGFESSFQCEQIVRIVFAFAVSVDSFRRIQEASRTHT